MADFTRMKSADHLELSIQKLNDEIVEVKRNLAAATCEAMQLEIQKELTALRNQVSLLLEEKKATTGSSQHHRYSSDIVTKFTIRLAEAGILNPSSTAIERAVAHFAIAMTVAVHSDIPSKYAKELYYSAMHLFGERTRSEINDRLHVSLDGKWFKDQPYILSGIDTISGRPLILKILPTHDESMRRAKRAEVQAQSLLQGSNAPIASAELVIIDVDTKDDDDSIHSLEIRSREALKMPWFVGSLASSPQLSASLIAAGGRRISEALDIVHSHGLVHMDIKPSNILKKEHGDWFLSDFGSSTEIGEQVWSFTPGMYPEGLDNKHLVADPSIDWGLLLVTLVILLKSKEGLGRLRAYDSADNIDMGKLISAADDVDDPDLISVLSEIKARARW